MRNFSEVFRGIVKITFESEKPESFINVLRRNMPVMNIKKINKNQIYVEIYYFSQKHFSQLARENNVTILHQKCFGVPNFLHLYKKRFGMFVGGICACFIIYASSFFVWEIKITGINTLTYDDVCSRLYSLGFHEGSLKSSVDLEELYNDFLVSEPRVSWIAINFDGTVANVEIRESALKPEKVENDKYNIVASRDGQIVRVDAIDGDRQVEIGDVVTKGQLLISAFVETRHSGAMLRNAKGSVWAKTIRHFEVTVPLVSYEKQYTGKCKKQYSADLLGKSLDLSNMSEIDFKYSDRVVTSDYIRVFGMVKLPLKLTTQKYSEYRLVKNTITHEQAKQEAEKLLSEQIQTQLENSPILNKKINVKNEKDCVKVECTVECIEDIGELLKLDI